MPEPLIRNIDSIHLKVSDLDAGIDFYCGELGQELVWRTDDAAGIAVGNSGSEVVLETDPKQPVIDLLVDSADDAVRRFVDADGSLLHGPFEIPVGRAAVVADPWGNQCVLLDLSKGTFATDAQKNVIGVSEESGSAD